MFIAQLHPLSTNRYYSPSHHNNNNNQPWTTHVEETMEDQNKDSSSPPVEIEELDDIELIFCTADEDTTRELLVPIEQPNGGHDEDEPISSQSSSIDREESIDRFDESSTARLNKLWSQCTVLVETDISKCGVVEEIENQNIRHPSIRRNTLPAPPCVGYRPIVHREALLAPIRRKSSIPLRPVMERQDLLDENVTCTTKESSAQTDISALPGHWRSESYLAHKVAHTLTTLPSKFALPCATSKVPNRLRLADKTREARRVMLSDISFTSMVPELSRSADHLCHSPEPCRQGNENDSSIVTQRTKGLLLSPCDCRLRNRGSLISIPSPSFESPGFHQRNKYSWRQTSSSFDTSKPSTNIMSLNTKSRPYWASVPSSPTHATRPPLPTSKFNKNYSKMYNRGPTRRGSLPNLRAALANYEDELFDSGGSTESLIDEAEDYLRRSIDSMLTISNSEFTGKDQLKKKQKKLYRYSEPDLIFMKKTMSRI